MPQAFDWSDAHAREVLAHYETLVCSVARRYLRHAATGRVLEEADLRAEGRIAVLEALRHYQHYGVQERTWVRYRVRQRILDAIRKNSLYSRDEMHVLASQPWGHFQSELVRALSMRRIRSLQSRNSRGQTLCERIADRRVPRPDDVAHGRLLGARMLRALQCLQPRQRLALELGLFDGLNLPEAAVRMGITMTRVCQLQKCAVRHLQRALATVPGVP